MESLTRYHHLIQCRRVLQNSFRIKTSKKIRNTTAFVWSRVLDISYRHGIWWNQNHLNKYRTNHHLRICTPNVLQLVTSRYLNAILTVSNFLFGLCTSNGIEGERWMRQVDRDIEINVGRKTRDVWRGVWERGDRETDREKWMRQETYMEELGRNIDRELIQRSGKCQRSKELISGYCIPTFLQHLRDGKQINPRLSYQTFL